MEGSRVGFEARNSFHRESVTKYLREILVFMSKSTLRKTFFSVIQNIFISIEN